MLLIDNTYICVLISGTFEDCIEHLVAQRAGRAGDAELRSYVVEEVNQRFRNPDHGTISRLLKQFSGSYQESFRAKVSHDSDAASALASIINNKNLLAHEGTSNLQLTLGDIDTYYRRSIPILEALEDILL
jgi:hypothetical protein